MDQAASTASRCRRERPAVGILARDDVLHALARRIRELRPPTAGP
jgi:hypothetical protein